MHFVLFCDIEFSTRSSRTTLLFELNVVNLVGVSQESQLHMDRKADRCHMSCESWVLPLEFSCFFVRKSCWQMLSWNPEKKSEGKAQGRGIFLVSKLPQPWFTSYIHVSTSFDYFDSCCDLGTSSRDGQILHRRTPTTENVVTNAHCWRSCPWFNAGEKSTGSAASLPWAIHHLTPESQYLAVKVLQRHVDTANHVCAKHCAIPLLQATSAIHC